MPSEESDSVSRVEQSPFQTTVRVGNDFLHGGKRDGINGKSG